MKDIGIRGLNVFLKRFGCELACKEVDGELPSVSTKHYTFWYGNNELIISPHCSEEEEQVWRYESWNGNDYSWYQY